MIKSVNYEQTLGFGKMAYQPDSLNEYDQNFWECAGEYTSNKTDDSFTSEMAYMLVTLYRSEVS